MGMPEIKCKNVNKCCAAASVLQSIALQEAGLAHILNAEGEKIQKAVAMCDVKVEELLKINESVNAMLDKVTALEVILKSKLEVILPVIEKCPNCCKEHDWDDWKDKSEYECKCEKPCKGNCKEDCKEDDRGKPGHCSPCCK